MTPAIETRGLTKRYRRVTALSDCSITVPEGRISALVGPNGAGKTTLLRLLSGLASPTSADIRPSGTVMEQSDSAVIRRYRLVSPWVSMAGVMRSPPRPPREA